VYFCDSDDWIESDMFECMYAAALEGDCDIVFSDYYTHTSFEAESVYGKDDPKGYSNHELMFQIIVGSRACCLWTKLIKTSLCKKIDFPTFSNGEDKAILSQAVHFSQKIGYVNKPFYHWCYNPLSLSQTPENGFHIFIEFYQCYTFILVYLIDNKINYDESLKLMLADLYGREACSYYNYNKKISAEFKKSFDRIIEMKSKNTFTKEALEAEQKAVEQKIIELNRANVAGKLFIGAFRLVKSLIPTSFQKKIERLFVRLCWK
jgi:hypothetical protein